jgi:GMP synthase (glutamine-hydrolysing)
MRVLSVTHGPSVPGGVFDEAAEAAGHELERWVVPLGGTPRHAASYGAIMVFGGSMHPDQDARHPWLAREEEFLREALSEQVPVVGLCLGGQMLARAAGAWVGPAPEPEIGWFEIELTPDGRADPVLGVLPVRTDAFQWHSYAFRVPDGGVELARSAAGTQAFRAGERAWGLQFHAEVTLPMVRKWTAEEPDELPVAADELLAETECRIAASNEQGRRLCEAFLQTAGEIATSATGRESRTGPG